MIRSWLAHSVINFNNGPWLLGFLGPQKPLILYFPCGINCWCNTALNSLMMHLKALKNSHMKYFNIQNKINWEKIKKNFIHAIVSTDLLNSSNLKWLGGEKQVWWLLSHISYSDQCSLFRPLYIQITLFFPVLYHPLSFLLHTMSFQILSHLVISNL